MTYTLPTLDGFIAALSPSGAVLWTQHVAGTGSAEAVNLATNSLATLGGFAVPEPPASARATMFLARFAPSGALTAIASRARTRA